MTTTALRIAISGAGVGGAILANLLGREPGIEVTCLEQVSPDDHSDAGTGLNVGPNAIKALTRVAPALSDALRAPGVSLPWQSWRTTLTDGTLMMDLPLPEVADNDGIRIRWAELYRQLRAPAQNHILFNQTVTHMGYEDDADTLTLTHTDGASGKTHTLTGIDMLIGGDGRYSVVREQFLGRPEPRHLGVVINRVLVPDTSDGLIDDYAQWFNGPNRLLAFRIPGNAIYIAGAFPIAPGSPISDDVKSADALREMFTPADAPPSPSAAFLIDAMCRHLDDIHWARVQDIPPAFTDARGHILLLGDAAHAMVPTLGQGATMAMEDACLYAEAILEAVRAARKDGLPLDVSALCKDIAARREARARFVVDFSWTASDTMLPGTDTVGTLREKTGPAFQEKLRQLYTDTWLDTPDSSPAQRSSAG